MPTKDKERLRQQQQAYRAANREKLSEINRQYRKANREALREYERRYCRTPRGRYVQQKSQAKQRGIPFLLTFDEWWNIWQESGKWEERGSGRYMMCRTGDSGAYAIGNVRIDSSKGNNEERSRG